MITYTLINHTTPIGLYIDVLLTIIQLSTLEQ